MEEKKSITISITTLLLVVAIIIIAIMGYFIYHLSNEKQNAIAEAQNLNNQVANLESTVSNLQSTINNVSNAINSSTNSTDNLQSANLENCKTLLEEYLNLVGEAEGSPTSLVVNLELLDYKDINESNTIENNKYILTTVDYSDFETALLQYATKECISKDLGQFYKNHNGYVALLNVGATGLDYQITNMELTGTSKDSEIYSVDYSYENPDGSKETGKLTATMELADNHYLVSNIDFD